MGVPKEQRGCHAPARNVRDGTRESGDEFTVRLDGIGHREIPSRLRSRSPDASSKSWMAGGDGGARTPPEMRDEAARVRDGRRADARRPFPVRLLGFRNIFPPPRHQPDDLREENYFSAVLEKVAFVPLSTRAPCRGTTIAVPQARGAIPENFFFVRVV